MKVHKLAVLVWLFLQVAPPILAEQPFITFCGDENNDLFGLLKKNGFSVLKVNTPDEAVNKASPGTGVVIASFTYPDKGLVISKSVLDLAVKKKLRLYVEYPCSFPGLSIKNKPYVGRFERGVVTTDAFGRSLSRLSLLQINDVHVLPVTVPDPLIVLARVAGLNRAEYGIDDVEKYPVLFKKENAMISMTRLSNFASGRYAPKASWKELWRYLISWLSGRKDFTITHFPSFVDPMYTRDEQLPRNARTLSISKGSAWFYKGRFLVHSDWQTLPYTHMRNYLQPGSESGPPLDQELPMGDGSLGILEGHTSNIYRDGRQQYRYWIRYDVQGEVAYALASSGKLLRKGQYAKTATKLGDFLFYNQHMLASARGDTANSLYGLIGWAMFKPQSEIFYGDDNARAVLGLIGASAYLNSNKWDKEIVECILGNFRTTGKYGFRGDRLGSLQIDSSGWKKIWNGDIINPHPHFESWMWACYLWLYDKTKYKPLLDRTKIAIRKTMEAYPDKWRWTNGIQQERARMILPLAWLVRVEDTEEHRKWLDIVVKEVLENQDHCGGIREELGEGKGMFGRTASNKEYGLHEAPLIFENGDKVSDMLYTSNFAFFALNEAAHATGNLKYKQALHRLSDFLTRIQVKSDKHVDIDGAWFRGFDYGRWDYWGSNADVGWGVWSTLTGWTQSWIIATQVLVEEDQSYWDVTKRSDVNSHMSQIADIMFRQK